MIRDKDIIELVQQLENINNQSQSMKILHNSNNKHVLALCNELNILLSTQEKKEQITREIQANSQKMLSNISHDLKTPLTVISGLNEMIDFEHNTPEQNKLLLQKIDVKITELHSLITTFFDLAKLESHDYFIDLQKINIVSVSQKKILEYYDVFEQSQIKLDLDFPTEPIYIQADVNALHRILDNLISNALKYGADGKVVGLCLKEQSKTVDLIIWDKGKGIEEKYTNQIFERLFTLEDSRNKNYSGSGIGLTITKRLVEKLQGTITLSSIPYQYTEFKISFPKSS